MAHQLDANISSPWPLGRPRTLSSSACCNSKRARSSGVTGCEPRLSSRYISSCWVWEGGRGGRECEGLSPRRRSHGTEGTKTHDEAEAFVEGLTDGGFLWSCVDESTRLNLCSQKEREREREKHTIIPPSADIEPPDFVVDIAPVPAESKKLLQVRLGRVADAVAKVDGVMIEMRVLA